jgi:hypothetical protein
MLGSDSSACAWVLATVVPVKISDAASVAATVLFTNLDLFIIVSLLSSYTVSYLAV